MTAPDRVLVTELVIRCVIGDLPRERKRRQTIFVDLALECDCREAAQADDLRHALDYVAAADLVRRVAVEGRFRLLEALADRAATALLDSFANLQAATVRVRKSGFKVASARWLGVEITRRRA